MQISYLFSALKSHDSNKYYINGNWVIDLPKGYDVADTTVYYTRPRRDKGKNEGFIAAGPTSEDLDVMVRRNKQITLNVKIATVHFSSQLTDKTRRYHSFRTLSQ